MTATESGARARLTATGFARELEVERFEPAPPGPGQVLIEVEACGVCYRDLIDRRGGFPFLQLPITPGHEAAGRVVAVGPPVDGAPAFEVGLRVGTMHRDSCGECAACRAGSTSLCASAAWVFGILADGGYATHLVAPARALYPLPDALAPEHAAVMHCTFGTAYRDLVTLGRLAAGERVVVTGANGGVGSAGVQIAHRLGAEVVAIVRDARHEPRLRALGADHVIVDPGSGFHKHPVLASRRAEVVLDATGASTFNSSLRSLAVGGRAVVVGNIAEQQASLNLGLVITSGLTIVGGSGATPAEMAALLALHAARPFDVPIEDVLPLESADLAQRRLLGGGVFGRLVLRPAQRGGS
ncbi:MAG: alcohol dehydrogenase catalytic domain-containing protein [Polyangiaceae bacterium]|nr:alcohol dehydrogenase catalytic domain-containing protein [Polyangiaceae bacterium]